MTVPLYPREAWRGIPQWPFVRVWRSAQYASLLLTRSYWGLVLALNWWDVIDEQFLLGGVPMFDDVERLQQQGVGAVVNLCAERLGDPSRLREAGMDYLWLPVVDANPPTLVQIRYGLTWIAGHIAAGRAIYIHCAAGIGRSATLLACWYVATKGLHVPQALHLIKKRRPQVAPTRRQLHRLQEFAAHRPWLTLPLPPSAQAKESPAWRSSKASKGVDASNSQGADDLYSRLGWQLTIVDAG